MIWSILAYGQNFAAILRCSPGWGGGDDGLMPYVYPTTEYANPGQSSVPSGAWHVALAGCRGKQKGGVGCCLLCPDHTPGCCVLPALP